MKRALVFLAALAMPAAAIAHHGWSSYDGEKALQVDGPLSTLSWANPHGTATMEWRGGTWRVILAPVARMEARGLTSAMIAPGKPIRLVGYARKDGTREMRIERVIAGGKTVELR
jgi:hypothetical protein